MQKFVAVFVAALLAVTLAGCGGGGSVQATTPPATNGNPAPAAAVPPAPGGAAAPAGDVSQPATGYPAPFPEVGTATAPAAVVADLESGQPMLLLFEDSKDLSADDVRSAVDAVMKKYRGLITLHVIDVAKVPKPIDPASAKGRAAVQALALANRLGVGYMPYIVIVNSKKTQTFRSSGMIDAGLLDREVLRATQ
jgi:hypothetical protein